MRFAISLAMTLVLACSVASLAAASGIVDIETTSYDNAIVLEVTVDDRGGPGTRPPFILERHSIESCDEVVTLGTFEPTAGVVSTHLFGDGPLPANSAHTYTVRAPEGYTWAGDLCGYGFPIVARATTGPGPAFLGRGQLDGSFSFDGCPGQECAGSIFFELPPDAWQYVDTGATVAVYGSYTRNCGHAWVLDAVQVIPVPCTVPVAQYSWTKAKSLYR